MTASEIAFLAIGLMLGIAAGAGLLGFIRSHPGPPPEVRVTMATDAIPRRSSTLADDAFTTPTAAEPARGGPADRRSDERRGAGRPVMGRPFQPPGAPPGLPPDRTSVRSSGDPGTVGGPSDPTPGTLREPVFRLAAPPVRGDVPSARPAGPASAPAERAAVPISGGADPMLEAIQARQPVAVGSNALAEVPTATGLGGATGAAPPGSLQAAVDAARARAAAVARARADASGNGTRPDSTGVAARSGSAEAASGGGAAGRAASAAAAGAASAEATIPGGGRGSSADGPAQEADVQAAETRVDGGPCGEARLLAEERCELAERARAGATAAEEALRAAQRAHDDHQTAADQAAVRADARAIRAAKDEAQARFRSGRGAAITTEEVEAAARAWLVEINAINSAAREATAALTRERDAANELVIRLERLAIEADAARISAETAEEACLAARQAHADCEEREAAGPRSHPPILPPVEPEDAEPVGAGPGATLASVGSPRIFRLLRGDRAALAEVAAALGGDDPEARRTWQLQIADLVDAILADSIASASLDFPQEHGFWGPFTRDQDREIVRALSSLGYRFDGLGGWVDGRVPSQRDLSLALGYAGLDPMRMRHWPTEREMAELFADVEVAGAEHLSGAAGDLTLGELVSMLGRRADGLAEVWNHWGRIRPLLLEEA